MELTKEHLDALRATISYVSLDLAFKEMKLREYEEKDLEFVKRKKLSEEEAKAFLEKGRKSREKIWERIKECRKIIEKAKEGCDILEGLINESNS